MIVKRLRIEGVAGRVVETVAEVVDELDSAGEIALDPVSDLRFLGRGVAGAARQRGRIDLRLYLPLHAGLGTGYRGRGGARGRCAVGRCQLAGEGGKRHHDDLGGRLCRRRAKQWVQRLEQDVGRSHQRDPANGERPRRSAWYRCDRDGVADPGLERRGELLVEHHLTRRQSALQEPHRVKTAGVAGWYGQDGAVRRLHQPRGCVMRRAGERRGRRGVGGPNTRFVGSGRHQLVACLLGRDRSLPVKRHATNRRRRHD